MWATRSVLQALCAGAVWSHPVMLVEMMSEPTCVLKESERPQHVYTYRVFVLGVSLISFHVFQQ